MVEESKIEIPFYRFHTIIYEYINNKIGSKYDIMCYYNNNKFIISKYNIFMILLNNFEDRFIKYLKKNKSIYNNDLNSLDEEYKIINVLIKEYILILHKYIKYLYFEYNKYTKKYDLIINNIDYNSEFIKILYNKLGYYNKSLCIKNNNCIII